MNNRTFKLNETEQNRLRQRESQTRNAAELRRLQAVRLYGSGLALAQIVAMVGNSWRTIQRWVADYQAEGMAGLIPGVYGQNAKKLSDEQRADFVQKVEQYGPEAILGTAVRLSQGTFWTVSDAQVAVKAWYGVNYSDDSCRRLLYEAGLSYHRAEGVYRSKPSQVALADFEEQLEKKSLTSVKPTRTGLSSPSTK